MGDLLDRTERLLQLTEKTEPLLSSPTQSRPPGGSRALYLPARSLDWNLDGVRVLERAYWLLQKYGWKQGVGDETTRLTLDQAVHQAYDDLGASGELLEPRFAKKSALSSLAVTIYFQEEEEGEAGPGLDAFDTYVRERPWGVVAKYNDDPGRSLGDIFVLIADSIACCWKANASIWRHRRDRAITHGVNYSFVEPEQES